MLQLRGKADKKLIIDSFRSNRPPGLYANENLTQQRSSILYAVRQAKKKFPDKLLFCGSTEGRVFTWLRAESPNSRNIKLFVNDMEKLEELCMNHLKVSSAEFNKLIKSD